MTITLQCEHCKQTMAIAPRKPGTQVSCPACGRGVVVPGTDGTKPATAGVVGVAAPAARGRETATATAPRPSPSTPPIKNGPQEAVWSPRNDPAIATELITPTRERGSKGGVTVPVSAMILSLVFALSSLVMAFVAGYLLGKRG